MTDKLTAAQLRDLADVLKRHRDTRDGPSSPQSLVGFMRDEAARREAGDDTATRPLSREEKDAMLNGLVAKLPDAPPPPADDLPHPATVLDDDDLRRMRKMGFHLWADAIEALRAERDAAVNRVFKYDSGGGYICSMTAPHVEAHMAELAARVAALEGAALRLANAADAVGVEHFDTDTFDPEVLEMQQATIEVRQALAAGGGNG